MKNILIIFLLLFAVSCSYDNKPEELNTNKSVSDCFNEEEIEHMSALIEFYDSVFLHRNPYHGLSVAYISYLNTFVLFPHETGAEMILDRDRELYCNYFDKYLQNTIAKSIWRFDTAWDKTHNPMKQSLSFPYDSKYMCFLKKYSGENPRFEMYHENIENMGTIAPGLAFGFVRKNDYNFEDPTIRLIYIIHLITMHYEKEIPYPDPE